MRRLMTSIVFFLAMPVVAHAQDDMRTVQAGTTSVRAPSGPSLRSIVRAGDTLYVSGQVGSDPATDEVVSGSISNEVHQTLKHLKRLLESEGASMSHVVKCTVFLTDIADFDAMNKVYRTFFPENPPARTTVQVAALPDPKAHVEIDCIAIAPAR